MKETLTLVVAFTCGAVPFSYLVAQAVAKTDLRTVGSGTVSGTSLYQVAGFAPLALGGILDVIKAIPALLIANGSPLLSAFAIGFCVAGHNWSPFIGGHGGRGISPALGGFLVFAWPGTVLILSGLAVGRLLRHTGLVTFVTLLFLPWLLLSTHGAYAFLAGWLVTLPALFKRVMGNAPPPPEQKRSKVLKHRLVFDNDGEA